MSRLRPRTLRSIKLRGRNEMCRLSGRHDLSILLARALSVNTLKTGAIGAVVPTLVHIGQECVDAPWQTLAPDSGHIVGFRLSSTTSRAADSSSTALVSRDVLGGKHRLADEGFRQDQVGPSQS
jgi:hypothetical protein